MWGHILTCLGLALAGGAMADPAGFVDDFKSQNGGLGRDWHVAHYEFDHPSFDTDWRRDQLRVAEGLTLKLDPQSGGLNRFAGASIRRETPSHYGRYEVELQAARGAGVVTGFFTYTGPHYGTRHDEIDIEFLGRNTRQMHVAWFVDGKLTNHFIDLGFDAADRPRRYAFEWWPDRLAWFAEGEMIFEHHARDGAIPTVPGRLFANLWAADPSIAIWAGTVDPDTSGEAQVKTIRFAPYSEPVSPESEAVPES